ncbi:PI-PLC X domain-containing protein At5g67130-like isoform X1 [Zingiber officinale]|uniref:PI-PLC X domain-containing protein At5g67130-like isoform X1 n=2 Tax=Zingiber officinale TaxID=94328 RepID=UPI001C4AC894|nr:PI-PLC X domain-containing protein At5g67130-like isoform X1 [Zingiber officinale]
MRVSRACSSSKRTTFLSRMGLLSSCFLLLLLAASFGASIACSNGECQLLDGCSSDSDCQAGLYCFSCGLFNSVCVRQTASDQFKIVNTSLPFNKYAFLTTHNSFAITGEPSRTGIPRITFANQEDNVTQQLNNGVRALMLDTYDFEGDIWLCHSNGGECNAFTAFEPAIDTMKEIETFLSLNPSEIVTLILEDYVKTPNGLTKLFNDSGLLKYWFPVSNMPTNGQDWPFVSDMVAKNQRLIVFTSRKSKQDTEGIAYQWNYMVENQYGDGGIKAGTCFNRAESAPLNDTNKSLVLVNYFPSTPIRQIACEHNSEPLFDMLITCHGVASNRWANFVAVDFYKRSDGGGVFEATDMLNGKLLCGRSDVHLCTAGSPS